MSSEFFFQLTPDRVLEAVETSGFMTTGRCTALNSFENRVYDVELETDDGARPVDPSANRRVVKFYRPGRWTEEQILEEHRFIQDLVNAEIPAIAPLPFPDGSTLHRTKDGAIFYAIFPRVGGRAPDELTPDQLVIIGRLLGRIHAVGSSLPAPHRVRIGPETYGIENLRFLVDAALIPLEFQRRYQSAVERICQVSEPLFHGVPMHRLHGDCHLGNLLWNGTQAFFLDFDDMVTGPAVQDLWLLLPGRDQEARNQWEYLLEGYEEMRVFNRSTLRLVEPLRALRFVHYTAWIARRWKDPAFPLAFPQFGTYQYWSDETDDLETQLRLITEALPESHASSR